ncbi:MAG: HD domain-containing protein [Desulfobulbaceae bacterium]|jgi:HD-GYP domain-containing protein (c-di-GMP phosphodiesterase class II)|nr:HD domain-containing protein [Desulfobulbaceae bacterium]
MNHEQLLDSFLMLLCRLFSNRRLYFSQHGKIKEQSKQIAVGLKNLFDASREDTLFIGVADGNLVHRGQVLTGPSITGARLIQFAEALRCGGFIFSRQTDAEEIERLADLTATVKDVASLEDGRRLLKAQGIQHIELANPYNAQDDADSDKVWSGREATIGALYSPAHLYQSLYDVVNNAFDGAGRGHAIDILGAQSVSEHLLRHTRTHFCDTMQKVHYPDFDTYTVGHCVRVAALAVYTGMSMGFADKMLLQIGTAALLHDVGKSRIPSEIVHKRGALDEEEYRAMKLHPALGLEILLEHDHATDLDRAAAWGHHIRHDGKGYPLQPAWATRHPITALLQVCDVFEALTAIRPYKKAKNPTESYQIMLEDKGGFHPGILAQFIRALGLYPPGNTVKLSDGRQAKVMTASRFINRPGVLITHDEDGYELEDDDTIYCDLSDPAFANISISELRVEEVV